MGGRLDGSGRDDRIQKLGDSGAKRVIIQFGQDSQRPLLVWYAGVSWDAIVGTDRQMVTAMGPYADVLWVDPPISPLTPKRFSHQASRWPWPDLSIPEAGLARLSTKTLPFQTRAVALRDFTGLLVRKQTWWALRQLGRSPVAVVASHLGNVLDGWGPDVFRVLYGTDDYVAGAALMGRRTSDLVREECRQLAKADVAVVISEGLASRWRSLGFKGAISVVPNGVNVDAYRSCTPFALDDSCGLPRPIAGLVGQLSDRVDIDLLESVIEAGCSLLLVGPLDPAWQPRRFARLIARPTVRWVGAVPFSELPVYFNQMDVGITPYSDTPFNRASFPLKTLEYISAGKPVVSSDLPAARWLDAELVDIASKEDFGRATWTAATREYPPDIVERRRRFAAGNDWKVRAAAFARVLGLVDEDAAPYAGRTTTLAQAADDQPVASLSVLTET